MTDIRNEIVDNLQVRGALSGGGVETLALAVRVAMTASATVGGIQQLSSVNNNFGTGNFSIEFDSVVPTTRPAADIVLDRKHDGTNGYILSLRTTGIVRLQINGANYYSTVAIASATNVNPKLLVSVVRETSAVAGSVTFYSQGVIVGTAVAITAHPDPATERVTNGTFDTDISGWTAFNAVVTFDAGTIKVDDSASAGADSSAYRSFTAVIGKSYTITAQITAAVGTGFIIITSGATPSAVGRILTQSTLGVGTHSFNFVATATTMYVVLGATGSDIVNYDNVSIKSAPTATTTAIRYVLGTVTTRTDAQFQQSRLYNRALSAAEALNLSIRGPSAADVGAPSNRPSQTPSYASDFSAGVDGWVGSGATLAGGETIAGESGWLKVTATATGLSRIQRAATSLPPDGNRRRVGLKYYVPSASVVSVFSVSNSTSTSSSYRFITESPIIKDVITTVAGSTVLIIPTSGQHAVIWFNTGFTSGDVLYFKEVFAEQIGITSSLSAEDCQADTGQILDRANNNHALMPASGATRIPIKTEGLVARWTNSWAETHEAQYIGGVNQPILPARAYVTSIIGVITSTGGSGVQDVIVGNGSDTDHYVTITTGLAAGTQTFTLAANTTDLTNLKLTVDPDANCTMSIAWTITYNILEA